MFLAISESGMQNLSSPGQQRLVSLECHLEEGSGPGLSAVHQSGLSANCCLSHPRPSNMVVLPLGQQHDKGSQLVLFGLGAGFDSGTSSCCALLRKRGSWGFKVVTSLSCFFSVYITLNTNQTVIALTQIFWHLMLVMSQTPCLSCFFYARSIFLSIL